VRDVNVAPVGAGGGGNVYSPSTWAKQRRSEFKAGQLSHQQSMSVSNMANTVDMDDNERKIVTEFCHYLEKSKQLFNGLRLVTFLDWNVTGQLTYAANRVLPTRQVAD